MKESQAYRAAFLSLAITLLLSASNAFAVLPGEEKNLRGRLGLGFTNQIAVAADRTVPALSTKYYVSRGTALGLGVGFDTRANDNTMALGLKGYKNVFLESNLIFYIGMGFAFVNHLGSKFQGSAFLGSEFFFERVPSLGLSFEVGLRGDSTTGSFAIRTTGDSFLTAGMHFYL
jgi:hypothetical protein